MSLFTSGCVPGTESLSAFSSFVIVTFDSASYSSEIHATFVKICSLLVGTAVTVHSICIVSESNVVPLYASRLSVFDVLFNFNRLSVSLYESNSKFPDTTLLNTNPVVY